ncbi:hypothetical protein NDU88_001079 [Pleurodeles waltl]|uniref:Uncharacterized protein n=1 Tax=Pleurodeles waltl TaxID=8319 RepID=A0AAV7WHB4_PLEWA|nr:hypothetical protein NDU88_001078 [Pleurodeles waltl]KAJ1213442.1 hypothetical protein NDU88_001079 [Pleurodeles waltl]
MCPRSDSLVPGTPQAQPASGSSLHLLPPTRVPRRPPREDSWGWGQAEERGPRPSLGAPTSALTIGLGHAPHSLLRGFVQPSSCFLSHRDVGPNLQRGPAARSRTQQSVQTAFRRCSFISYV